MAQSAAIPEASRSSTACSRSKAPSSISDDGKRSPLLALWRVARETVFAAREARRMSEVSCARARVPHVRVLRADQAERLQRGRRDRGPRQEGRELLRLLQAERARVRFR